MPTVRFEGMDGVIGETYFGDRKRAEEFVKKVHDDDRYAVIINKHPR
jgi:hypothetical protein